MVGMSSLKQYQVKIYFWTKGERSPKVIARKANLPYTTVYKNLKKFNENGSLDRRTGQGRKRLIKSDDARVTGQYLRRNKELTAQEIATKLVNERGLEVFRDTVTRHLKRSEYKCFLPLSTPMLTENHKRYRIELTKKDLNTDWNKVILSDETSYQLFRNMGMDKRR